MTALYAQRERSGCRTWRLPDVVSRRRKVWLQSVLDSEAVMASAVMTDASGLASLSCDGTAHVEPRTGFSVEMKPVRYRTDSLRADPLSCLAHTAQSGRVYVGLLNNHSTQE